eukprot:CAMPEP_0178902388 /NCGR_PEP_ID=MMETSP0786-20121207/4575_1 /TAXON_ID=186022 /ORGANISM="Thalassionema frauenfeldii, Strain CCMP 1798" /LENGTH=233 /DNA_ID=CAMNT_0020573645 /DNA_START=97 /DNA_END=794 /DNA_ORIENTATION=-
MLNGANHHGMSCRPIVDDSELGMKATKLMFPEAASCLSKQVRFGNDPPDIILSNALLEEEEIRDLWWNRFDLESFSQTAKGIAKQGRHYSRISLGLDEGYKRIQKIAENLDDEESTIKALQTNSLDPGIMQWCVYGHSRRGLERYGSMLQAESRRMSELSLVETIRNFPYSADEEEVLRNKIEKQTRASRIFARMIGLADEVAVTRQNTYLRRWSDFGSRHVQQSDEKFILPL